MNSNLVEAAARALVKARREHGMVEGLPEAPTSLGEIYQIQDRVLALLGGRTAGWYCAATSKEIQRANGLSGPYCAPIFANALHPSPALLPAAEFPVVAWECEFAFRLARDLPPRKTGYVRAEVADAIAAVHPIIEVLTSRLAGWREQPVFNRLADNGSDGAIIYGDAMADWRNIDLAAVPVTLSVNGEAVAHGVGANVLGHPLEAMCWLVNAVGARCVTLRAGDLCNTGTVTGLRVGATDQAATADFGILGIVSAKFSR